MPVQLDLGQIKAESRSLLRSGTVSPYKATALLLAITLVLDVIDAAVSYMIDTSGGLTVLSFSFVSILVSLISIVLNAGYLCYCLGIRRGEPFRRVFLRGQGDPALHRRGDLHFPVVAPFCRARHHRGVPLQLCDDGSLR